MDMTVNKIPSTVIHVSPALSTNQAERDKQDQANIPGDRPEEEGQIFDNKATAELIEKIQGYLDNSNVSIDFSTYGDRHEKISITVTEKETGKVIREIPPEELQRLYLKMGELMGMIFNDQL